MPKSKKSLSEKIDNIEIFCWNYLKHFNHHKAWAAAFPDKVNMKSKQVAALKYLNSKKVQKRLREIAGELMSDMQEDVMAIIEETKRMVAFNPLEILDIDENGEPVLNLNKAKNDPQIMRLLNIKFSSTVDKEGNKHQIYEVKPYDKMDALEKLYKYHKLYSANNLEEGRTPIQVNVQFPIPGQYWRDKQKPPKELIEVIED